MFATIRGILLEPTVAFSQIDKKATVTQAAGIAIAVGLLRAVPVLADTRHAMPLGVTLLISWRVASSLAVWVALSFVGYLVGTKLLKGTGTFRAALIAVGFAGFITFLGAISDIVVMAAGLKPGPSSLVSMLPMVFFGWYSVLLFIGLREANGLRALPALISIAVVALAGVGLLFPLTPVNWLIDPILTREAFPVQEWAWADADVPPSYGNVLRNPGFETAAKLPEPPAAGPAPDPFGGKPPPENWLPSFTQTRWTPLREQLVLSQMRYSFARDATRAHTDQAGALVKRVGLPFAAPLAWGWLQRCLCQSVFDTALKNVKKEDYQKLLADIEGAKREMAVCGTPAGEEVYFSIWVRGENVTAAAAVVTFWFQPGKVPLQYFSQTVYDTFDWHELRIKATVPADAQEVDVGVYLWGNGELWADDARLLCKAAETVEPARQIDPKTGLEELEPEAEQK